VRVDVWRLVCVVDSQWHARLCAFLGIAKSSELCRVVSMGLCLRTRRLSWVSSVVARQTCNHVLANAMANAHVWKPEGVN
jgi:hypothetical protein